MGEEISVQITRPVLPIQKAENWLKFQEWIEANGGRWHGKIETGAVITFKSVERKGPHTV